MDTKQKSYIDLSTFYNGRLKVYKKKYANRNNTVSKVYFGRTNVNGKVKELSSGESNKRKAILLLKEKYNDLLDAVKYNRPTHDFSFKKLVNHYYESSLKHERINENYKADIFSTLKIASNAEFFNKRSINQITDKTVINYFNEIRSRKTAQKKTISSFTLDGKKKHFLKFFNWCLKNNYLKKKIEINRKDFASIRDLKATGRTYFTFQEYEKLRLKSLQRIKEAPNYIIRYRRSYLHQFIILIVNTGLRTDEAYNLKWNDIVYDNETTGSASRLKGVVLKVYGKTGFREVEGKAGALFALKNLEKTTLQYNDDLRTAKLHPEYVKKHTVEITPTSKVFPFYLLKALNELLVACDLKFEIRNSKKLRRDSKSLRATYISWECIAGTPIIQIAKNCGTSPTVIDEYYTKHLRTAQFRQDLRKINRLRLVS